MWRYRAVLPDVTPVTLGEVDAMLRSKRYANAFVKKKGANPTGALKREAGTGRYDGRGTRMKKLAVPFGGKMRRERLRLYAPLRIEAKFSCRKMFRSQTSEPFVRRKRHARGWLISDCGGIVAERKEKEAGSTFYFENRFARRKKTMGYNWSNSLAGNTRAVLSTGGGVGLIGMWKAFIELEELGWVRPGRRPRNDCGAIGGCAPVARAFSGAKSESDVAERGDVCVGLRGRNVRRLHHAGILKESGGVGTVFSRRTNSGIAEDWRRMREFSSRRRALRPRLHMTTY